MSKAEIERFNTDVKADSKLQEEVKAKATSIRSLVEVAKAKGYDFSVDEVKEYARSQNKELSDDQLDAVTGGRIPIIVVVPAILIVGPVRW